MPSTSPAQAILMAAVAHGWKPNRIKGPPKNVAQEYNRADTGSSIRASVARTPRGPQGLRTSFPSDGKYPARYG